LPEPGTPLFHQHGKALAYDGYTTKFNARLIGDGDAQQVRAHPDLYSTYYYYPAAMPRETYTFAVDAVDAFRGAGHDVLSYALRFFQNRLSVLVDRFREWVKPRGPATGIDRDLVVEFIADRFGAGHHLTSLFKFGFAIDVRGTHDSRRRTAAPGDAIDLDNFYRLNPQTHIFTDLHDCADLLERVRALPPDAPPLTLDAANERNCYVTVVDADRSVHYRVEHGVEDILRLFERPQKLGDVMTFLRDIAGDAAVNDDLLDQMIEIGALVRAANPDYGTADALR